MLRRGQDPNPPALGVGLGVSHPFLLRGERAVGAVVGGSATASPPPHHGGAAMLAPRGGAPPRSDLKWHFSSCIFGASQTPAAGPGPPLGPGYPPLGLPCRARSPPSLFQPSARGEQTQRSVPPPPLVAPSWNRVWDLCDIPASTAWVKKIKMHQNPPAPGCSLRPRGGGQILLRSPQRSAPRAASDTPISPLLRPGVPWGAAPCPPHVRSSKPTGSAPCLSFPPPPGLARAWSTRGTGPGLGMWVGAEMRPSLFWVPAGLLPAPGTQRSCSCAGCPPPQPLHE